MREEEEEMCDRDDGKAIEDAAAADARFLAMANCAPCLIWQCDDQGACAFFNSKWEEFTGRLLADLQGDGWLADVHEEDRDRCVETFRNALSRREEFRMEYRLRRYDGQFRWIMDHGCPLWDEGDFNGFVGCAMEMHDRVEMEVELRSEAKRRETLLRELHHRVKNNMQVISSMLNLQLPLLSNARDRELLEEMKGRIRAMALVHERLLRGTSLDLVEMKSYASALMASLRAIHGSLSDDIEIDVHGDDFACSLDCAIPMGLIINELVSNSFKYASARAEGDASGAPVRVEVSFHREEESLVLTVEDNGVGFPEDFQFEDSPGVGLRLVSILSRQLRGRVEMDPERRARVRVRFSRV